MSVRVDNVTVRFGDDAVLERCSLSVGTGEIVAVQGPSGSGKSTLLRVIAGLVSPDAGRVLVDDVDVTAAPTHRRGVGLVFQDNQLFDHLDVAGNVGFGLRMAGVAGARRAERVEEMLAFVGLADFGARSVTTLSGGEAKRVAVARSLAPTPRVLLLDEPLTGLGDELRLHLAHELAGVVRRAGITTLVVTHADDEAAILADRVTHLAELRGQ